MEKFDLVFVSYNSEKWIDQCFGALLKTKYNLKLLNVYVVDNNSTDNTIAKLKRFKEQKGNEFGTFSIVEEKSNWGFGIANNIGFSKGDAEYVCFLNIDTEVFADTFSELEKEIRDSNDDVALWEFRQFPYEHPKLYDPVTKETDWASGAAFAVRRNVYSEVGGFDEEIFMYAEDVDLSWRIRSLGYKIHYTPRVKITHYSYESAGEIKPNQHVYGVINNLLLRYRYVGKMGILEGHARFWSLMRRPSAFPKSKRLLFKQYLNHFTKIMHFYASGKYKKNITTVGRFIGWEYNINREGAFYYNELPETNPLVSVIVRTCGRPDVLRETLISLKNQTYDNMEVVVVEDGPEVSKNMIDDEFGEINIRYHATGTSVGRSKAGNIAMGMAKGKYLNLLDDDDLFYADHIEVLVKNIEKTDNMAVYSLAFETPITVFSKSPYEYEVKYFNSVHKQEFDRMMLCHHNYIPIQCIMFSKTLFEQYGGFDETVDALEDWDMWVRYSTKTDFGFVYKTTSLYRVPAKQEINEQRQKALDDALVVMRKKHASYNQQLSVRDICKIYERMM